MANFFDESFERRTNQRLGSVSGDAQLATLITLSPSRPHLFLAASPERTPWLNLARFNETGGRGGLARFRQPPARRHRYRAVVSGPRAEVAAVVRVAGERPAAAAADRLGHRAAKDALA